MVTNVLALPTTGVYADVATTLPRERLPYGNMSQVMEVLKVQFIPHPALTIAMTAATFTEVRMYLSTKTFAATEPSLAQGAGTIVSYRPLTIANTAAAPAVNINISNFSDVADITDNAGNGVLVATDSIVFGMGNTGVTFGGTANMSARILYRWKNVGLQEYIGIVQSQQ
jgi:hypothetical protein